ncbi:MAG: STAS domain-containing protein [bacterium]|nr:MAG: STAS domain-containing protein [bacterium]
MEDINIAFSRPEDNPDVSIVSVDGYIDTTTASELEESLKRLLSKGRFNIVIDLGGVNYISSAGWGIFISEIKKIRENGGDLKLAKMVADVYEVFELLEFQTILESFDSLDDAVGSFGALPTGRVEGGVDEERDDATSVASSNDATVES